MRITIDGDRDDLDTIVLQATIDELRRFGAELLQHFEDEVDPIYAARALRIADGLQEIVDRYYTVTPPGADA